ncbi:cobW-domain-containing protein [Gonapodya prolifera JEL478]|uniref:CobW-domain-containing protein n=1 Tax=Gonapodya prolifera (strain JEL478) TaxID=1344416 RepID=A0A139ALN7_GONPJ|nr:cobW-domain-containing protein [Gonapodya prolifera JEL478]|eukprot:KXS17345.1 cobW-domain-containing protein [Gonapodya prolifera JEL478]
MSPIPDSTLWLTNGILDGVLPALGLVGGLVSKCCLSLESHSAYRATLSETPAVSRVCPSGTPETLQATQSSHRGNSPTTQLFPHFSSFVTKRSSLSTLLGSNYSKHRFLGSGKTTLLNHILTSNHGLKVAVIENEFGEVGVDDALVSKRDKLAGDEEHFSQCVHLDQILEMNNGCICCTVRGDLIGFLTKLASRKVDLILIETTGLADPAPVAQTFFVDDKVSAHYELDAILTVVDAKHIWLHLEERTDGTENEAIEQIAFADVLILNKLDLIENDEDVAKLRAKVTSINRTARIIETRNSEVDPRLILNQRAFDLKKILELEPDFLQDTEHQHDQSVTSVGLIFEYDLVLAKLEDLIGELMREKGNDLLRYKGVLPVRGMNKRFVFQGVHMLFGGNFSTPWGKDKREGRFIFIGRNLDRAEIIRKFEECKAVPLRFEAGQGVQVNLQGGYRDGVVTHHWDEGNCYKVFVPSMKSHVWAPDDIDEYIKVKRVHVADMSQFNDLQSPPFRCSNTNKVIRRGMVRKSRQFFSSGPWKSTVSEGADVFQST